MACLVLGVANEAQSQTSSLRLSGVVDVALRHSDNGKTTLMSVESGGMSISRLGLQGSEELVPGLRAAFHLESTFQADSGGVTPAADVSRFWGRRATVSLISARWGELRMGRSQTPLFNMFLRFDPFTCNGIGTAANLVLPLGTRINPPLSIGQQDQARARVDNSIQWGVAPGDSGAYGEVLVSAGEGVSGNRHRGARLGWIDGPVQLSAALGRTQVYTVAKPANEVRELGFAGSYDFGAARVIGHLIDRRLDSQVLRLTVLSATWRTGPHEIRGSWARYSNNQRSAAGLSQGAGQFSMGYVYDFSRRTSLYGTYARIANDAGAALRGSSLPAVPGQPYTGVELGIRHGF